MKHLIFITWVLFCLFIMNIVTDIGRQNKPKGIVYLDNTKVEKFVKSFKGTK